MCNIKLFNVRLHIHSSRVWGIYQQRTRQRSQMAVYFISENSFKHIIRFPMGVGTWSEVGLNDKI